MIKQVVLYLSLFIWIPVSIAIALDDIETFSISGTVLDSVSNDALIGAHITLLDNSKGTSTNSDGEFELKNLKPGTHIIRCQHIGYKTLKKTITIVDQNISDILFKLAIHPITLREITVTPGTFAVNRSSNSSTSLSYENIQAMAQIGEDIYRAVTRFPGIAANDFSATFSVRGGEYDEILVLLDGLELYEPFHIKEINGGAISIIDSRIVDGINLNTGGFTAEYGNRLSGVFNIRSRTPENSSKRTEIGISFMNMRGMSEGTFYNNRGKYLVSLRKGYMDIVLDLMDETDVPSPEYYDFFSKVEYKLTTQNQLCFNILHATDKMQLKDGDSHMTSKYGNSYLWFNLKSIMNPSLFVHTILSGGRVNTDRKGIDYHSENKNKGIEEKVLDNRRHKMLGIKQAWTLEQDKMILKWGLDFKYHDVFYDYFSTIDHGQNDFLTDTALEKTGKTLGLYLSNRLKVFDPFTVEIGARWDYCSYADDQLSPRINGHIRLTDKTFLRMGWGHYYQYQNIHELPIEEGVDRFSRSELAKHWTTGLELRFNNGFQLRLEGYYKYVSHLLPSYRNWLNDIDLFPEVGWDRLKIDRDHAISKGLELYLKHNAGEKLSWWASYILAFYNENINQIYSLHRPEFYFSYKNPTPGSTDQRHAIYTDVIYRPHPTWSINLSWAFHSGWPYTERFLRKRTDENGNNSFYQQPGEYYAKRYDDYHRLNIRMTKHFHSQDGTFRIFLEFINLYNHDNVRTFEYHFNRFGKDNNYYKKEPKYWFHFLPSIGVSWTL